MASKYGELSDKESLLYDKVQQGAVEEVKNLLNDSDVRIDCLDEHGMTPLQHAAYRGNYELCKLFLDRGANVNSNHHDGGYSTLTFAGLAGKLDVVSLILEHGASTTAVNSVGRTASQMAAFVGNHEVVSIINNFIPKEDIEYYTKSHGVGQEPKLPIHLVTPLYRFVLKINIHPIRIAMYLQQNIGLLDNAKKVVQVLELLCEKEFKKSDANELLSLKFHHLAYVVKACDKFLKEQEGEQADKNETDCSKGGNLELLIKNWIKGRENDGFPVLLEKMLRQSVREYPYHESSLLQHLVLTLAPVEVGDEPSAISILAQAVSGQRGYDEVPTCNTCGEPRAEKRCSKCKSVQYCDQTCQKLHWFTHKKQCPRLAEEYIKAKEAAEKEKAKEEQKESTEDNQKTADERASNLEDEFHEKCNVQNSNVSM